MHKTSEKLLYFRQMSKLKAITNISLAVVMLYRQTVCFAMNQVSVTSFSYIILQVFYLQVDVTYNFS